MTKEIYALSSGFGPYGDLACYDEDCLDEFGFIDTEIQCDFWDQVTKMMDCVESVEIHNKINITEADLEKGAISSGVNMRGSRWFKYRDDSYSYINRNRSVFIK